MKVKKTKSKKYARAVEQKLKDNGGYCPCSVVKNEDTKCMCKAFRDQIKQGISGYCHCGLYMVVPEEEADE